MAGPVGNTRRSIVKAGLGAMGAVAFAPLASGADLVQPPSTPLSESLVTTLYKSLNDDQRKLVCLPFNDPDRDNAETGVPAIHAAFNKDQQEMIRQIFVGLHSPEYADRVIAQVIEDNGDFRNTSINFFGEPGTGNFEFVHAGNHLIRRCSDGSVKGAAFHNPIWYGHDAGGKDMEPAGHPGDAYFYQARQASQVFRMLDGRQRRVALVEKDPGDWIDTVRLSGKATGLPGIPMTELSSDQRGEVRKTLALLLAPFRQADAEEAMNMVGINGFDHLHMAFYKSGDVDTGDVWNIWQIEGPAMHWYFRGVPHVHAYVHIRRLADA